MSHVDGVCHDVLTFVRSFSYKSRCFADVSDRACSNRYVCPFLCAAAGDVDEDTSDANVDGDALSRIGRALGIHEPSEDSDSEDEDDSADSASGARGDVRKKQEDGDAAGQKLSLEDMIWWLMMFPFFEKEFDMVGVVGAGLFAEEDSDVDSDDVPDGFSGDLMLIDGNDDDEDEIEDASSDAGRKKRKGVSIEEL